MVGIKQSLPATWRWARLATIVASAEAGFACGQRDAGGVVQLRMNNVDTRGNFVWKEFIRVPADSATVARYRLEPGDILFNNTNSVELVGKTALFAGYSETVVYSNHFTRVRVAPALADPAFVSAWLLSRWQAGTFENICNRWIGQSAVKNDKLLALQIPLPPLQEQKRIAANLNEQMAAVERTRAAAETQLEGAKSLPAAYLRAVFESPEAQEWPQIRLGETGEIVSGVTLGRKLNGAPTRRVPYLRVANVKDSHLESSDVYEIDATNAEIEKLTLKYGDLLLTEGGDPDKLGRGTF